MKILHLLASDRFSGAENVVCQIIGMMKDEPDTEMIYCSRDGQIREALAEREIAFAPISDVSVSEVKRVIKEYQPDVIHAHDMRASFVAARACGKITLISHIHNNAFDSRGLSIKSIAYLLAARKAKHIFWVSQSAYKGYCFYNFFAKKSEVLYNIIDIDTLYKKMEADTNTYDFDISYVGRLSYPKNPERLMNVLKKVTEKKPDVKVAIIGTGELEKETKELWRELSLENNVYFLGFQSNPLKILHDSKVMIMTSRWEGTPMCALEAMALGVPIVSTPVDGLKVLIENGKNGYLEDDDDILAERIVEIISDSELHGNMSKYTAEKAKVINDTNAYKAQLKKQYKLN